MSDSDSKRSFMPEFSEPKIRQMDLLRVIAFTNVSEPIAMLEDVISSEIINEPDAFNLVTRASALRLDS